MEKYTEFSIEKIVDAYRELTPDYEVRAIQVDEIINSTINSRRDIIFRKGNKTLPLEQAIKELHLPSPDDILLDGGIYKIYST